MTVDTPAEAGAYIALATTVALSSPLSARLEIALLHEFYTQRYVSGSFYYRNFLGTIFINKQKKQPLSVYCITC